MKILIRLLVVFVLLSGVFISPLGQSKASAAPLKEYFRNYDRAKAAAFARANWNVHNLGAGWGSYYGQGGDCTNFISRVLYEGGMPEDKAGSYQWYWDNYNPPTVSSSRSASWSGASAFYNYIIGNTNGNGFNGPQGNVYATRNDMELGDIVQMNFNQGAGWSHSAVVTKTWWSGNTYYVAVTYHDTDRLDKNLNDIPGTSFRYIKIRGSRIP